MQTQHKQPGKTESTCGTCRHFRLDHRCTRRGKCTKDWLSRDRDGGRFCAMWEQKEDTNAD